MSRGRQVLIAITVTALSSLGFAGTASASAGEHDGHRHHHHYYHHRGLLGGLLHAVHEIL